MGICLRTLLTAFSIITALILFNLAFVKNKQVTYHDFSNITTIKSEINVIKSIKLHQKDTKASIFQQNVSSNTSGDIDRNKTIISNKNESCVNGKSMITGGFCLSKANIFFGFNWLWDSELCSRLEDLFGLATVVDFGAGLGQYGRCLLRIKDNFVKSDNPKEMKYLMNIYKTFMTKSGLIDTAKVIKSWTGYDGAENIGELSSGYIKYLDLSKEVDLNKRWDWAISLEVGEHIPADSEDVYIDNVVRHTCKGIVLSWAVPGQWGQGHINNQYNSHVIEQLKKRRFKQDLNQQTLLRQGLNLEHFVNTIMVFRAEDENRCQ